MSIYMYGTFFGFEIPQPVVKYQVTSVMFYTGTVYLLSFYGKPLTALEVHS